MPFGPPSVDQPLVEGHEWYLRGQVIEEVKAAGHLERVGAPWDEVTEALDAIRTLCPSLRGTWSTSRTRRT